MNIKTLREEKHSFDTDSFKAGKQGFDRILEYPSYRYLRQIDAPPLSDFTWEAMLQWTDTDKHLWSEWSVEDRGAPYCPAYFYDAESAYNKKAFAHGFFLRCHERWNEVEELKRTLEVE